MSWYHYLRQQRVPFTIGNLRMFPPGIHGKTGLKRSVFLWGRSPDADPVGFVAFNPIAIYPVFPFLSEPIDYRIGRVGFAVSTDEERNPVILANPLTPRP